MNKENTKIINAVVSVECWRELNILRYRKHKETLNALLREILENYTNKHKDKENVSVS